MLKFILARVKGETEIETLIEKSGTFYAPRKKWRQLQKVIDMCMEKVRSKHPYENIDDILIDEYAKILHKQDDDFERIMDGAYAFYFENPRGKFTLFVGKEINKKYNSKLLVKAGGVRSRQKVMEPHIPGILFRSDLIDIRDILWWK